MTNVSYIYISRDSINNLIIILKFKLVFIGMKKLLVKLSDSIGVFSKYEPYGKYQTKKHLLDHYRERQKLMSYNLHI